jgi:hypothetical protein
LSYQTPVFRPNLSLYVVPATSLAAKLAHLTPILKANTSGPAIIYVGTQKDTETIAFALQSKGLGRDGRGGHVRTYHGGMASAERMKVQDAFMASKNDIVVATIVSRHLLLVPLIGKDEGEALTGGCSDSIGFRYGSRQVEYQDRRSPLLLEELGVLLVGPIRLTSISSAADC